MSTRSNNFNVLRLLGALLVALSHTFDVFGGSDPLATATNNQSLGGLGLNIFCVISGFLITKSRDNNDAGPFFKSRALRILPALAVSLPIMALIVGPIVSQLGFKEYLASGGTWRFLGSILVFPLNPTLPGVFSGAPLVAHLYSLTAEVSFYLFVGVLCVWKHYGKLVCLLTSLVFAAFIHFDYTTLSFAGQVTINAGQMVLFTFPLRLGLLCIFYLLAGSVVAKFCTDTTRLTKIAPYMLLIWLVALVNPDRRVYDVVEMITFPIAVVGIGISRKYAVQMPDAVGDLSYGIYIWHFMVAEIAVSLFGRHYLSFGWMTSSIIASCLIAYVSFHLVEKQALAMKQRRVVAPKVPPLQTN